MDPGIPLTRDSTDESRSQFVRCSLNLIYYILINSRYAALSKTGEADALAAQDLSLIQGLNEQEIQTAIEELKRSTAAIEKQSEVLRLQQNAMNALVKNGKKAVQGRSHAENAQVRKWDVEKGHINSAVGLPDDQYTCWVLRILD
jgi:hypothetical protein